MEPELRGVGWRRFNFPWFTGYSPKKYCRGFDFLIHKDPNDCRPHRLRPILIFDIEANLQNNNIGKLTIKTAEYLDALALEQCRKIKYKATDIQALNTFLFYDLARLKRITSTNLFV